MTLSLDEYMDLLLARREEYYAEHGQPRPGFPALPEWFIRDGDEHLVDMDAIDEANRAEQPRPERKPRNYKPASHWREVLERIDARLAALDPGPRHGTTDPAAYGGIGIRQTARQERRWAARIDRTAAEHVRLTRRRAEVAGKLARAEAREAQTRAEESTNRGLTCENGDAQLDISDPPGAFLAVGSTRGSDRDRSSAVTQHTAPTPTSVYRYYDASDVLIYVGITGRGMARNVEHNKSKDWWPFVARQEVDHFDTREDALAEERRLIRKHYPPFNRQHNPHHEFALASYMSIVEALRDRGPAERRERQQRRRHLPLTPLEAPFPGDVFTLRTDLADSWVLHGQLIPQDQVRQRVSTPQRSAAGHVTTCRLVGGLLVVGIAGKHLPDRITDARAKIALSTKPEGFKVSRVLLNEADLPATPGGAA